MAAPREVDPNTRSPTPTAQSVQRSSPTSISTTAARPLGAGRRAPSSRPDEIAREPMLVGVSHGRTPRRASTTCPRTRRRMWVCILMGGLTRSSANPHEVINRLAECNWRRLFL